MMYGHIKTLKTPGERAKAYARAINDLAAAESGLREWCLAATIQAHRPAPARASSRKSNFSAIGLRPDGSGTGAGSYASPMIHSLQPHPHPHPRNVSASSEFPLREDSYTAREISQRHIDPTDQPTGLPANLPYPQLQQLRGSGPGNGGGGMGVGGGGGGGLGGIKSSPSMQSVVSTASSKKSGGFFSAMRKGKKDSLSLGPPNTTNKKDVRGLPISSPDTASFPLAPSPSPGSVSGQGGSSPGAVPGAPPGRLQSSAAPPLGPRGMRMGSFTPPPNVYERASIDVPPRGSFDTSTSFGSRTTPPLPARGSFDSTRTKGSLPPPRGSPMGYSTPKIGSPSPGSVTPREEDVRAMADVLPHVEKGVIRTYLARHGEQMQAIGAYLEDEKRGSVMRV